MLKFIKYRNIRHFPFQGVDNLYYLKNKKKEKVVREELFL